MKSYICSNCGRKSFSAANLENLTDRTCSVCHGELREDSPYSQPLGGDSKEAIEQIVRDIKAREYLDRLISRQIMQFGLALGFMLGLITGAIIMALACGRG